MYTELQKEKNNTDLQMAVVEAEVKPQKVSKILMAVDT